MKHPKHVRVLAAAGTAMMIAAGLGACGPDSIGPPPPPRSRDPGFGGPDSVIEELQVAYRYRDLNRFAALLHSGFEFCFEVPPPDSTLCWDTAEELRIHQRMFRPENAIPPASPVPDERWVVSIDVTLTQASPWRAVGNPADSLFAVDCNAALFFETQGDTDYRIDGQETFVVKPERIAGANGRRRYWLYRWWDAAPPGSSTPRRGAWGWVKTQFR